MKFDIVFVVVLLERNKCVGDFSPFGEEHVWNFFPKFGMWCVRCVIGVQHISKFTFVPINIAILYT